MSLASLQRLPPFHFSLSSLQNLLIPFISSSSPLGPILLPTNGRSTHNSSNCIPINLLHLLSLCQKNLHLKSLKSLLIVSGQFPHYSTLVGYFLRHCFQLGDSQLALSTFNGIEKPNLYLQNLVIRSLSDDGLFEDVLFVYRRCRFSGCPSDNYTFPFVIKACSALSSVKTGKEVHCVVCRTGFGDNVFVQTALVDFYGKIGEMGNARLLHDRIPQPDLVSWNALISGYSLHGLYDEVFEVLQEICVMGLKPNVSTLASIIPVCSRSENFRVGVSLHGFAFKSGNLMDENLAPAFLSMYANVGDLSVARDMFDSIPIKNVTLWNAMISAYTRTQKSVDAFVLFRKLLQDNVQPNMITFVSIIPSCDSTGSVLYGESLHACVLLHGFEDQLPVATVLVSMYAKFENIDSAAFIFYQMPHRNILSWNSMVSGYVHNGCWGKSLAAFREMALGGFEPDAVSIVSVLSSCSYLGANLLGKSAHAFIFKRSMDLNLSVSNALLAFYSDCHAMTGTLNLFHKMAIRNAVSWNTLISGFVHDGNARSAIFCLHQMQQEGMEMDLVTLISVLPCFSEAEDLAEGMVIHGYAIKRGFSADGTLSNALISMYVKFGELVCGKLLFENLANRSVVSWNALLTGYRHQNLQNEVMLLFGQMIKEEQEPNYISLLNILPVCYTLMQGKSIHAYAARTGFLSETPLLTALMLMYARFDNMNPCVSLFQMGGKSNISLWNAITSAHVQSNNAETAISLFCELLRTEMEPDHLTILTITSACIQFYNHNLSNSIMAYIIQKGFDKDVAISNALIDLYARSGFINSARMIFDNLLQRDAISWSVLIKGYALHGDGETALALLSQMTLSGLLPDDITYVSILSACSHAGLVEEGRKAFNSMIEHGIVPRMEHYSCMMDLLGRTGNLCEAYELLKSLNYKPFVNQLESLLGSCLVHRNFEIGEEIGRLLLQMDFETSGPYVVLYNLYAAAGRWGDACKVRFLMESKRVTKLPGFSLIEKSKWSS